MRLAVVTCTGALLMACSGGDAGQVGPGLSPTEVPVTALASAPPEPTGVAGLDDSDAWCAAWVRYAATVQVLSVAASFGGYEPGPLSELELAAAPVLVGATDAVSSGWPAVLEAEREAVVDRRIGPQARRAGAAVGALRAAGITDPEIDALARRWTAALARRDPNVATFDLPAIDSALAGKVAAAARQFATDRPAFAQDPSLVTEAVATPATDAYLASHCPATAASGLGDAP